MRSRSAGCLIIVLCSISHRYLVLRSNFKRRELLAQRISVLYERLLAIEVANQAKKTWNGGIDEETAEQAMEEISRVRMAEAA